MNTTKLIICFCFISFSNFSQKDSSDIFNKKPHNSFSIRQIVGYTDSKIVNSSGTDQPNYLVSIQPVFETSYLFNFTPSFGLGLRAGVGSNIYLQKNSFIRYATPRGLFDFSINPEYRIPVRSNFLNFSMGFGVRFSGQSTNIYGISIDNSYTSQTTLYFSNSIIPFTRVRIAYDIVLKSKDHISFNLGLNYLFKNEYKGEFSINNNNELSTGTINPRKANLSVGIGYTFSLEKRYAYINNAIDNDGISRRTARKELKTMRRYLNPKSTLISGYGGFFMNISKAEDKGNVFGDYTSPSWISGFNIEQGWKKNYYLQAGFHMSEYWLWTHDEKYSNGAAGGPVFIAYSLNLGMMKRINVAKNRNLIDVSAGMIISVQGNKKGKTPFSGGGGVADSTNTILLQYYSSEEIRRNIFPTFYVGLSKDFQLTQHLSFTMNYRYQIGLLKVIVSELSYTESSSEVKNATIKINGEAHSVTFGLKYNFLRRRFQ